MCCLAFDTFDAGLAVERGHDATRDRQADAGSLELRGFRAQPLERQVQPLHLLDGDSAPGVGDRDADPAVGRGAAGHSDAPAGAVVLHGVGKKIEEDLLEPLTIGEHEIAAAIRRRKDGLDLEPRGERADEFERVVEEAPELDRLRRKREPSGLDARDVEHLIDERQQMPPGARDVLDALRLAGRRFVELEELGEAEYRVHRRAQLVAHARKEFAIRAVRSFGLFARQADAGLRALALDRRGQDVGDGLEEIDVVLHELAR